MKLRMPNLKLHNTYVIRLVPDEVFPWSERFGAVKLAVESLKHAEKHVSFIIKTLEATHSVSNNGYSNGYSFINLDIFRNFNLNDLKPSNEHDIGRKLNIPDRDWYTNKTHIGLTLKLKFSKRKGWLYSFVKNPSLENAVELTLKDFESHQKSNLLSQDLLLF